MKQLIETSHCRISVETTDGQPGNPVILFIHGNSSCKEVFKDQLGGSPGKRNRCIAVDLPGHGQSDNAIDPALTYTMTGYADCLLQVVSQFHDGDFIVVGWSLGGHIGIEMLDHTDRISGLMISGTPPIGPSEEDFAAAFLPNEHMRFTGQETLTGEEAAQYAHTTCGSTRYEAFLGQAVRRTDGTARRIMLEAAMRGEGVNQKQMVETSPVPLAIVNGCDESLVNNDYVRSIAYANLWRQQVFLIENAGHAPFWDQPVVFNDLLDAFARRG